MDTSYRNQSHFWKFFSSDVRVTSWFYLGGELGKLYNPNINRMSDFDFLLT